VRPFYPKNADVANGTTERLSLSSSPSTRSVIRPVEDRIVTLSEEMVLPIFSILSFAVFVLPLRGRSWIAWRIVAIFWRRAGRVTDCGRQGKKLPQTEKNRRRSSHLPGKGKVAILVPFALHYWRATRCTFQMPTALSSENSSANREKC